MKKRDASILHTPLVFLADTHGTGSEDVEIGAFLIGRDGASSNCRLRKRDYGP